LKKNSLFEKNNKAKKLAPSLRKKISKALEIFQSSSKPLRPKCIFLLKPQNLQESCISEI
jgi:hypothetical protein